MREIKEIIIHCSDTQEGVNVTAADIRRWHTTPKEKGGRGWRDIGYHYVIGITGMIEIGRPIETRGAHCIGRHGEDHNSHSIGICYIGGRHINPDDSWTWADTRTEAQKEAMIALLRMLKKCFPKATIHGHNEFADKVCPCFDVQEWLADLREAGEIDF